MTQSLSLPNLIRTAPSAIKRRIAEEGLDPTVTRFLEAIDRGEPWALSKFFDIVGVTGHQNIQILISQKFGVDETELAELVEGGKRLRNMTSSDDINLNGAFDSALEVIVAAVRDNPERREEALRRLGAISEAEVIEESTNGHG